MNVLKSILGWPLENRKLAVLVISAVLIFVNDATGKHVSNEAMWTVIGLISAWLVGQGIADAGSQGAARAVAKAMRKGGTAAPAIIAAVSKGAQAAPDEGPAWEHTAAQDAEDKTGPGPLNG